MKQRAKYGIDAPGVVRAHIVLGALLALLASLGLVWPTRQRYSLRFPLDTRVFA